MKRNYSIDTLRTLAASLVIILHVTAAAVNKGMESHTYDTAFWIANIFNSFSRICVPLFVLISGRFLLGKPETFKEFYQKRSTRILWPLVTWSVVYVLYLIVGNYVLNGTVEIGSILWDTITGRPFYHLWYLFMLTGLYFITPVINYCLPHVSKKNLWFVALGFIILSILLYSYDKITGNKQFFMIWFIQYLGYFLMGFLMKEKLNISSLLLLGIYIVSSVSIAILTYFTAKNFNSLYFYAYPTPFVILGSISIYLLFSQLSLSQNVLSKIAPLTLGIYVIHAGILDITNKLLMILGITALDNPALGVPIKFTYVLITSLLLSLIISKIKYINKII